MLHSHWLLNSTLQGNSSRQTRSPPGSTEKDFTALYLHYFKRGNNQGSLRLPWIVCTVG